MAGQADSENTVIRRERSPSASKQVIASRKQEKRIEVQALILRLVYYFFVEPRFSHTKYCRVVRLHIKEGSAIRRWQHIIASGCHTARTPSEGRHSPNLVATANPPVVDFLAVGREIVHDFGAFVVVRKLKRLATRGEHDEHLIDATYGGAKRHGMTIGR